MKMKTYFKKPVVVFVIVSMITINLIGLDATIKQEVTFTGSKVSGEPGDQVEISVAVSEVTDLGALTLDLKYDSTKLTFVSASKGADLKAGMADVVPSNGIIRLTYINIDGFSGSGVVLKAIFKINENAVENIPLIIDVSEIVNYSDYLEIPNKTVNGSVEIMAPTATPKQEQDEKITINKQLKDARGNPVANRKIKLCSDSYITTTDEDGFFFFNYVPFGPRTLYLYNETGTEVVASKTIELGKR